MARNPFHVNGLALDRRRDENAPYHLILLHNSWTCAKNPWGLTQVADARPGSRKRPMANFNPDAIGPSLPVEPAKVVRLANTKHPGGDLWARLTRGFGPCLKATRRNDTSQARNHMPDTATPEQVATFLTEFGDALAAGDIDRATGMFHNDCYWRDLVTFTWNIKTMEGHAEVADMLRHQLAASKPSNWRIAQGETPAEDGGIITAWITFETALARGYGLIRLKDGKIFTLLTSMVELKGFEEPVGIDRPLDAKHGAARHQPTRKEEREAETRDLGYKTQPYVLSIGGGQGGIALAARLRQLNVPTIVVEKNERPADSWRNRYKSLCRHNPVWYDHLPYLPFPPNWPVFSPKDKIGDWLEMYTKIMELNYWTKTTCKHAS